MSYSKAFPVPNFVAFDLETTGLLPDEDDILEVALIKFEKGQVVSRCNHVLRPDKKVPLKVVRLTGIPESVFGKAKTFSDVASEIEDFRRGYPLVGHNSAFDTAFLSKKISAFPGQPVYDTLEICRILCPTFESYRLGDVAVQLGVSLNDAHRAYDDAEASGHIFIILQKMIGQMTLAERQRIACFLPRNSPTRNLFEWPFPRTKERPRQISLFQSVPKRSPIHQETVRWARNVLNSISSVSVLKEAPFQKDAARALVEEALSACHSVRRLIVGIPNEFVPKNVYRMHLPDKYLCLRKFEIAQELAEEGELELSNEDSGEFLPAVASWLRWTKTGDLRELTLAGRYGYLADELSCVPESCPQDCKFMSSCFERLARKVDSPIVFSSYTEALLGSGVYQQVIVWNIHEFVNSIKRNEPNLRLKILRDILNRTGLLHEVSTLGLLENEVKRSRASGILTEKGLKLISDLREQIQEVCRTLRLKYSTWDIDPPFISSDLHALEKINKVLGELTPKPNALITAEQVYLSLGIKSDAIASRWIWPGDYGVSKLRERLGPTVLITHQKRQIGSSIVRSKYFGLAHFDHKTEDKSPFERVLYMSLDHSWISKNSEYPNYLKLVLKELCQHVRSGFYVVFPSRSLLEDVYKIVVDDLERQGIATYALGTDGGSRVLEHIGEDDSVVFVTSRTMPPQPNFPDPTCILVAKVPFGPPIPVDEERRKQAFSMGLDGFQEVNVKDAVMALTPHVERMLQTGQKCSLVLADPRVLPGRSSWGQVFVKSLLGKTPIVSPLKEASRRIARWIL